jgi:hypothetical protein
LAELAVSDSGALTGTSRFAQFTAQIEGTVEGNRATGTSSVGPAVSTFEATLSGDRISWVMKVPSVPEPMRFETTRVTADGGHAGGPGSLDPQLIGKWRRTVSGSFNAGGAGVSTATDIFAELRADGTYHDGDAAGGFTGTGRLGAVGGETGAAPTTTGAWKAESGILFLRPDGTSGWVPVGRYSLSGNSMGLQPVAGGEAQLWERQ